MAEQIKTTEDRALAEGWDKSGIGYGEGTATMTDITGVLPFSATIWGDGYIGGAAFDTIADAIVHCRQYDFATRFVVYDLDDVAVHEEVKDAWRIVTDGTRQPLPIGSSSIDR